MEELVVAWLVVMVFLIVRILYIWLTIDEERDKRSTIKSYKSRIQTNLFDTVDREKQAALAKAIDEINRKNGHNKIRVAVQGNEKGWQLKKEYISKQYTTNLDDVIVLKV